MKRLWKTIPPCLSDTLGFEAVLNQTEGLGIIDDTSHYKPLRLGPMKELRHLRDEGPFLPGERPRPKRVGDIRVVSSEIRNADIIMGTQQKVLQAFAEGNAELQPNFALLAYAPSASMIGSDLEADAELITQSSGLSAASVNIHGDKDYLYGISVTLEAMGKLLLQKQAPIANTVNLLGCNVVDWHKETLPTVERLVEMAGFIVLSRWGLKETTKNLLKASSASVNWVVNVSGLRLARYMEERLGIPYIVGAPFGEVQSGVLLQALREQKQLSVSTEEGSPEVLVIGEQLTANAIREALRQRGFEKIRVLSFFEMDKNWMQPGDVKLSGEDALVEQMQASSIRLVVADLDYKAAAKREVPWISLPNIANQSPVNGIANFNMAGAALDQWLDGELQNRRIR